MKQLFFPTKTMMRKVTVAYDLKVILFFIVCKIWMYNFLALKILFFVASMMNASLTCV